MPQHFHATELCLYQKPIQVQLFPLNACQGCLCPSIACPAHSAELYLLQTLCTHSFLSDGITGVSSQSSSPGFSLQLIYHNSYQQNSVYWQLPLGGTSGAQPAVFCAEKK